MKTTIQTLVLALALTLLTACGGGSDGNISHDTAISKFVAYAQSNGTSEKPALQDYLDAGVTGVTEDNLDEINEVIENLTEEEVDTTKELQDLADDLGIAVDTTPPVITIAGGSSTSVTQGSTYTDAGATATDDVDGTVSVNTTSTVDTNTVGDYTITYTATDAAGNTATATRTVTVTMAPDTTPPVISITGESSTSVTQNSPYTDEGATATDDVDGTVNVTSTGNVDTSTLGDYTITYTATDAAGNTATATRTVTVTAFSITHNGTTYGIVTSPYTGKVWLDRNLGATMVCSKSRDDADAGFTDATYTADQGSCFGDYYQWGRNYDGHQSATSSTTSTQATDVNSTGSSFITSSSTYDYDWAKSADGDGSIRSANWSATDGSSVCPVGFRVPTIVELKAETLDNGVTNRDTAFANFLKLPSAGIRIDGSGALYDQGSWGLVWSSSSVHGSSSRCVLFISGSVYEDYDSRALGFTVRCLRD